MGVGQGRRVDPEDAGRHYLLSGCQWNHLPQELGDDSTIHRTFRQPAKWGVERWRASGLS